MKSSQRSHVIVALTSNGRIKRIANWFDIGNLTAIQKYTPFRDYKEIILYLMPNQYAREMANGTLLNYIMEVFSMVPFKMPTYMVRKIIYRECYDDIVSAIRVWHRECNLYLPNIRIIKYLIREKYQISFSVAKCTTLIRYMQKHNIYSKSIVRLIIWSHIRNEGLYFCTQDITNHLADNLWKCIGWIAYGLNSTLDAEFIGNDIYSSTTVPISNKFKNEMFKDLEYVRKRLKINLPVLPIPWCPLCGSCNYSNDRTYSEED
jgi:hypothetical protein